MFWQTAGAVLGGVLGVMVGGGWVFLQYKRDQMYYKVLLVALERGLTAVPGSVPTWVRSLRQGVMILLLGIGVMGTGGVVFIAAGMVDEMPERPLVGPAEAREVPRGPAVGGLGGAETREGPLVAAPPPPGDLPRWERIQTMKLIGLITLCAGGILLLLGIARIAFSRIERRYLNETVTAKANGGA